jgi:hypothetical protein
MNSTLRGKLSVLVQRRLHNERRGSKRIAPVQRTLCLLSAPGEGLPLSGLVENLSNQGVALLAQRPYPLNTMLHLRLVNAAHMFSLEVEMKIVRCSRIGYDQYLIAGPFTRRLLHDEVVPFIL